MGIILIKGCELFQPAPRGVCDVLVAGGEIIAVDTDIPAPAKTETKIIDGAGLRLIPGLIDVHVHIAGAGGDDGPGTRTPQVPLGDLLFGGVTTAIGCLGLDGYTRTTAELLMRTKALRADGLSSWIYSGSYQIPPPTLTGDVVTDLTYVEEIIGVGETAISDHRASLATVDDLIRLAKQAKIGGMLGAKAGIVHVHMGDEADPFRPIYDAIEQGPLAPGLFYPTHVNRNPAILEDAKALGKLTAVDITAGCYPEPGPGASIAAPDAVMSLLSGGVPRQNITVSSDAGGSMPVFDDDHKLVGLEVGKPNSVLATIKALAVDGVLPMDQALSLVTENPARVLKLSRKGRVEVGMDADLVLVDGDFNILHLLANGLPMIADGEQTIFGLGEATP